MREGSGHMARNAERDRIQRVERQQQILDAAKEIFTLRGVAAAKMSDIAAHAGVSHGSVYTYFASKEELLSAMVLQGQSGYTLLLREMKLQPGDAIEKLKWLIHKFLLREKSDMTYWVVLQAQATDVLSSGVREQIQRNVLANRDLIIEVIEEGQKAGCIAEWDSTELATIFITAFHNMALWPIRGFGKPEVTVVGPLLKLLQPSFLK
ncbi:TetR/AcrR family transcriptional regulator [Paenibacillus sp. GCM10027627]|uniref:TetR/AcrR family transcriptional regulator n=1 Tax=unclassified Paenibacillus TaxID=185978 RepID=UPI0036253F0A